MTAPVERDPVSIVEVDENYLLMTQTLVASYQAGHDLNFESWAMTSAVPSLLAEVRRLRQLVGVAP